MCSHKDDEGNVRRRLYIVLWKFSVQYIMYRVSNPFDVPEYYTNNGLFLQNDSSVTVYSENQSNYFFIIYIVGTAV